MVAFAGACAPVLPNAPLVVGSTLEPTPPPVDRPWPLHLIDGRWRGSNALGPGDVDGDGLTDYVTNYEFEQRYTIELHPPAGADPRSAWRTVDLVSHTAVPGRGSDTEMAVLGDLDGDGTLDVIGAQGGHVTPFWEGYEPGIRVMWGPHDRSKVTDAAAWTDAGRFPQTVDKGHFLDVEVRDLNGDGAPDIVYGGRVLWSNQARSGLRWLEAPTEPARRRDLSAWKVHDIDPTVLSGHNFTFHDLDGDGVDDVVVNNSDFDTPGTAKALIWYHNPGPGSPAQFQAWPAHTIDLDPRFDVKPGLDIADLDGDGRPDLLTQTAEDVYWYRQRSSSPVQFDKIVIPKDPRARQFARPIRVADVNGDGRPDLVGGLVHEDGLLAPDKASIYWMEYTGDAPGTANWVTHVIRHGNGRPMLIGSFGEKWDHFELVDVDGDGDLDLVANSEEWFSADGFEVMPWNSVSHPRSSAVVWFENTLHDPAAGATESSGRVIIEAERPTLLGGGSLEPRTDDPAASGGGDLQAFQGLPAVLDPTASAAEHRSMVFGSDRAGGVRYDFTVAGGTYSMWFRRWVPRIWAYGGGGGRSDSIWASIDGGPFADVDDSAAPIGSWAWVRVADGLRLDAGAHQLRLRLREPGYAIDQIVISAIAGTPPEELRTSSPR